MFVLSVSVGSNLLSDSCLIFFWGNYSRKHSSHPYFMKIWRIWWGFHKDFHPSPCKTVGFLRPWPRTVGARTSPGEAIWRSWPVGRRWEWKVARFLEILGDDWMISMEMCGEFFFCIFDHFCTTSSDNHQIYTYIYIYCVYIYIHTYTCIFIWNDMYRFHFAIMISETGLDPGIPLHLKGNVIVRTFQVNSEKSALPVLVMYATTYPLYLSGWWFQTFFIFHNI